MKSKLPVALITGSARRLGAVIAGALADNGYAVAVHCNRSVDDAGKLVNDIRSTHGKGAAQLFSTDLTEEKACGSLIDNVIKQFGRLDLLVNNASVFGKTEITKITTEDIDRFHKTHVTAPTLLSIKASAYLKQSGHGRIINIVDIFADFPKVGFTPYAVSKAGLKSLTKQLAIELAPDITVNAIAPGAILEAVGGTDDKERKKIISRIPLGRFGSADDIASAVIFLANADYITGQTIIIDGGRTLNI